MNIKQIIREEMDSDWDWVNDTPKLNSAEGWEVIKDDFNLIELNLDTFCELGLNVGDLLKTHTGKSVYEIMDIDKSDGDYFIELKNIFQKRTTHAHISNMLFNSRFYKLLKNEH